MRFIYHKHGGGKIGWVPPILSLDQRVLVPAQLVPADDPRAKLTFTSGRSFDVNENDHKDGGWWLAQFCRQHADEFQCVNRGLHPGFTQAGEGNKA